MQFMTLPSTKSFTTLPATLHAHAALLAHKLASLLWAIILHSSARWAADMLAALCRHMHGMGLTRAYEALCLTIQMIPRFWQTTGTDG